jgi:hypothetical protein
MTITVDNYTQYALRTNQWDYPTLWRRLGLSGNPNPTFVDLYHGALGVFTEAGELCDGQKKALFYGRADMVNLGEEIGDCFWYLAIMANAGGLGLGDLVRRALLTPYSPTIGTPTLCSNLGQYAAALLCTADQGVFTVRGLGWEDLEQAAIHATAILLTLLEKLGIPLATCLSANIAKLQTRYPERFTELDAVGRNTQAERTKLETGLTQ